MSEENTPKTTESINDIEEKVGELITGLDKGLITPWEKKGQTKEEFMVKLKEGLEGFKSLLDSGTGDSSLVKSTAIDTLDFITWASIKKETHHAKTMIKAQLTREIANAHKSKRINKRR